MSRVRFEQIFRFLHLCDSSQQKPFGHPDYCWLWYNKIDGAFTEAVRLPLHSKSAVTIDEAIFPSKGVLGSNSICTTSKVGYIKLFLLFLLFSFALPFLKCYFLSSIAARPPRGA